MNDQNLLDDQPIAWIPTRDVIERSQLTKFMRQVGVSTWDELYEFSIRDVEKFTEEVLKFLDIKFDPPYEKLMDISGGVEFPQWFARNADAKRNADALVRNEGRLGPNGAPAAAQSDIQMPMSPEEPAIADEGVRVPTAGLNITTMCLDRWQTDEMKDQPAIIFESELHGGHLGLHSGLGKKLDKLLGVGDGAYSYTLTYGGLHDEVLEYANALRHYGLGKGDAIGIHLPMTPSTVVCLLAIARIGAIAVPVFSGYGVEAIAARLNAVKAKALFTILSFPRRGKTVNALEVAIEAVNRVPTIERVFWNNYEGDPQGTNTYPGLDERFVYGPYIGEEAEPEPTSAEDPLIILYTSGTTGKPKGIAHTHASFPIKAAQDMAFGTDVGRGTRISWYTDIGWMMGPWLIYGALINGATICIYDGAPDYPTPDRMWEFCAKHKVEVLGISPTLIRSLAAAEERNADAPVRNEGHLGPNGAPAAAQSDIPIPTSPAEPAIADEG
ncbi:MAG: AMP-binding protein, partial [Pyrinomonadaceae bacterium]